MQNGDQINKGAGGQLVRSIVSTAVVSSTYMSSGKLGIDSWDPAILEYGSTVSRPVRHEDVIWRSAGHYLRSPAKFSIRQYIE